MTDLTDDGPRTAGTQDDHSEIVKLLSSEAWTRRLEEARHARSKVLAQRARPAPVSVFRPMPERRARINLLPPLAPPQPMRPAAVAGRGVVVQLNAPFQELRPATAPDDETEAAEADFVARWQNWKGLVAAFVLGLVLGAVLISLR